MPSVLDYLGYHKPFYALGSSIFSNDVRYTLSEFNGKHMLLKDGYLMISYGFDPRELYVYPQDTNYKNNLVESKPKIVDEHMNFLKAITQAYRRGMIRNEMWVNEEKNKAEL